MSGSEVESSSDFGSDDSSDWDASSASDDESEFSFNAFLQHAVTPSLGNLPSLGGFGDVVGHGDVHSRPLLMSSLSVGALSNEESDNSHNELIWNPLTTGPYNPKDYPDSLIPDDDDEGPPPPDTMDWNDEQKVFKIQTMLERLLKTAAGGIKESELYAMFSSPSPASLVYELRFGVFSNICTVTLDRFGRRIFLLHQLHPLMNESFLREDSHFQLFGREQSASLSAYLNESLSPTGGSASETSALPRRAGRLGKRTSSSGKRGRFKIYKEGPRDVQKVTSDIFENAEYIQISKKYQRGHFLGTFYILHVIQVRHCYTPICIADNGLWSPHNSFFLAPYMEE